LYVLAMSDFASAIIVLHTPRPVVIKAAVELDLPIWVAPARGPNADRIAMFPNGEPKRIVRALAVHLPKALLVTVDVGDEIPVTVTVNRSGTALANVQLDDYASNDAVESAVAKLSNAMAIPAPVAKRKNSEPFRNVVYRWLGIADVVAKNHFAVLTQRVAENPTAFVGFAYVHDTTIRELTDDVDMDDEPQAKPLAPPRRTPRATERNPIVTSAKPETSKTKITRVAPAEAVELSATFRNARVEPARAQSVAGAEHQLATATNATEWLAIRRTIDPARVTADVLHVVVDVVRNGRFASEGERATVVREAAAMLLGRALKAQSANTATLAKLRGTVSNPVEQACWDIVARMAGLSAE
jgi:hypothetical protein